MTRWLRRLRWNWEPGSWNVGVDLSNLNLPRLAYYWADEHHVYASFTYGNGNSDPVLVVDTPQVLLPQWVINHLPASW